MARTIFQGYYALRFKVFQRDKFTCQYCGQKAPDVKLEVDHIKPVEEGGGDNWENLITSCWACNKGKASLSIILKFNPFKGVPSKSAKPFEGEYQFIRGAPRQNALVQLMKEYGPITPLELASKMNVSMAYAYAILSRYRKKGLICLSEGKWSLT